MHHCFELIDLRNGTRLTDHLRIHCFELDKVRSRWQGDSSPLTAWLHFFAEGESWTTVPDSYRSPSLEAAMSVLERYRNNQHDYEVYRAREEWLRVQATLVRDKQEAEERLARAQQQAEQEHAEKLQAQQILAEERAARAALEAKLQAWMKQMGTPPQE